MARAVAATISSSDVSRCRGDITLGYPLCLEPISSRHRIPEWPFIFHLTLLNGRLLSHAFSAAFFPEVNHDARVDIQVTGFERESCVGCGSDAWRGPRNGASAWRGRRDSVLHRSQFPHKARGKKPG